ncbi:hypothetical protein [Streptomyces hundungensis]|uniref:hypothetical protein n=1 Tax=Streptomyces hundungensis TaxID=1077946 RepID=UPI0033D00C61
MADIVDADELLRRIRGARDWTREQENRLVDADAELAPGDTSSNAEMAKVFHAVRAVLDRIIDPGQDAGAD